MTDTGDFDNLDEHLKVSFATFSSELKTVSQQFNKYQRVEDAKTIWDFPEDKFEVEVAEFEAKILKEKGNPDDGLHFEYLFHSEADEKLKANRSVDRLDLFRYYNPDYSWGRGTEVEMCHRVPVPMWSHSTFTKIHVEIKNLAFVLGELEPFFCSLALYDATNKTRLSENFYFDLNSDAVRHYLHIKEPTELPTLTRHAYFDLPKSQDADIWMVLRVEKILQGDPDDVREPYMKLDDEKGMKKAKAKVSELVEDFCHRLGVYRQHFCWATAQLTDEKSELKMNGTVSIDTLLKSQPNTQNIFETINEMRDPSKRKKMKGIPGYFEVSVSKEPVSYPPNCKVLDPSLEPVIGSAKANEEQYLAREIQTFPLKPDLVPYSSYVNNLYIYPELLNLTKYSKSQCRNVAVKVQLRDNDDSPVQNGLPAFFGKSSGKSFTDQAILQVSYHTKTPSFYDELKIKLPTRLHSKHHLLFTFHHVVCNKQKVEKNEKKGLNDLEFMIGFATLPLYQSNKLLDNDVHNIPIAIGAPEPHYLSEDKKATFQYVDNGKACFRLRVNLNSTVHTQSAGLAKFHETYHKSDASAAELVEGIGALREVPGHVCVHYFPVLMNELLSVMGSSGKPAAALAAFKAMLIVLSKIHAETKGAPTRDPLIAAYPAYTYDTIKTVHEPVYNAISKNFIMLMMENNQLKENAEVSDPILFGFSWFVFEVLFKALALKLDQSMALNDATSRSTWFDNQSFVPLLKKMVRSLTKYLTRAAADRELLGLASECNSNLALFVRHLFSVFDRGQVMEMVYTYLYDMRNNKGLPDDLDDIFVLLKFDFLRIVADYEHYIPLNFPLPFHIMSIQDITNRLCREHPLAALLMQEVLFTLSHPKSDVRLNAINTLASIIAKHDYDTRYQTSAKRERIANVYFLLILLLIDNSQDVKNWREKASVEERRELYICVLFVLKNVSKSVIHEWWTREVPSRMTLFLDILAHCIECFEYSPSLGRVQAMPLTEPPPNSGVPPTTSNTTTTTSPPLSVSAPASSAAVTSPATSPTINVSPPLHSDEAHVHPQGSSSLPSSPQLGQHSLTSSLSSSSQNLAKHMRHQILDPTLTLKKIVAKRKGTKTAAEVFSHDAAPKGSNIYMSRNQQGGNTAHQQGQLSTEAAFTILDILEEFIDHCVHNNEMMPSAVMDKLFDALMLLLQKRQSHRFLHSLFGTLRSFMLKFRKLIFTGNNSYCGDLCKQILRHCNFYSSEIRAEASAFFYLMLKHNYEEVGNFGRVNIQGTMALSKLADEGSLKDIHMLERSLATISAYALHSYSVPEDVPPRGPNDLFSDHNKARFARQVQELTIRQSNILRDTSKVNELRAEGDVEMVQDLYCQIALAYSDTPDLRATWLNGLASLHEKSENFAEAAICKMHVAALVADYLEQSGKLSNCKNYDPSIFSSICPSISESADATEEGTCQTSQFSVQGLLDTLADSIKFFQLGELYEFAIMLYKLVVSILESTRDYPSLAKAHRHIQELYSQIILANDTKTRMLGRYFRVGFYGAAFQDLDGKEFIYKEPKRTHLYAFTERMKNFFGRKFGEQNVIIFPDSSKVERANLETGKCYLQITYLKPYFTTEEDALRTQYVERRTNLTHFVYVTPFTLSGKSQGSITEQHHRKTILSILDPFPNLLKRYGVEASRTVELTPIENSIEAIERRSQQISLELNQRPPNAKTLQAVLQGSVLLQVNAGAMEICRAFLSRSARNTFPPIFVERLQESLRVFLSYCSQALALNKELIGLDQISFHTSLEQGFADLKAKMEKYLQENGPDEEESEQATVPLRSAGGDSASASASSAGPHDDEQAADSPAPTPPPSHHTPPSSHTPSPNHTPPTSHADTNHRGPTNPSNSTTPSSPQNTGHVS